MRLRIEHVALVGTTREVSFTPGLNIIQGGITTGKTTLMRLIRMLVGASVSNLPPEVKDNVSTLAGTLLIADERVDVVRPLVTTPTAKVAVATASGIALRLPALQRDQTASTTYGGWLLEKLGLPDLRVPTAPTKDDSDTTALSINDFTIYCRLVQERIDSSVLSVDQMQNVKRKQVFEVLYGIYDAHVAALEAERRGLSDEARALGAGARAFLRFLDDTPWQNRTALEAERSEASRRLDEINADDARQSRAAQRTGEAHRLRNEALRLDAEIASERNLVTRDAESVSQLEELLAQLETQSARLTKSIVAGSRLYDLEFEVCPRCASPVTKDRSDADHCYVCLQEPQAPVTREDLVAEQERLVTQINETDDLAASRREELSKRHASIATVDSERRRVGAELDRELNDFVSDRADGIAAQARERAAIEATVRRVDDYLKLYNRLEKSETRIAQLEDQITDLDARIEQGRAVEVESARRIDHLEGEFARFVEALGTPRFDGEPRAGINRKTYNPVLNGRSFEDLSSGGLKVLTNLAYIAAHHVTALDLQLELPHLLLIDGVTKNVGRDDYDQARVDAVFDQLLALGDRYGDRLQIIVAANDVPPQAADAVRLTLTESDRLVPDATDD